MKKILSFFLILISYLLVVFKIVIAIGIFNNSRPFIFMFFMSPLSSIFGLLLGIAASHPIDIVAYLMIALLILLLISWIVVIISLLLGLKSKKARKKLFIFSIVIAIYDVILLLGIALQEFSDYALIPHEILSGLILALCVIIVNIACLRLTSKNTNKRKTKFYY